MKLMCYYVLIRVCDFCVLWLMIERYDWWLKSEFWMTKWCNNVSYAKWIVFGYYMLSCFSLVIKNVITHFQFVVCVWILWWYSTLCSGEQMTRWTALRNIVLNDDMTQCSDRMWHWDISFYIKFIMLVYFILPHWFNKIFL